MTLRDILAPEGLMHTAAAFNVASPFARKLESLVPELMGPGSRVSVSMGRGEFSSKMGMQVRVINPNYELFDYDNPEDMQQKTDAFHIIMDRVGKRLSEYFGLPVHTETTEETVIEFTLELRVRAEDVPAFYPR